MAATPETLTTVPEHPPPPSTAEAEPLHKRKRENEEEEELSSEDKPITLHPLWKTSLCSYFRSHNGTCSHGEICRFAHTEAELRPRPDKSWDPTSDRAKKARAEVEESGDVEGDVMMTDALEGEGGDHSLSKCLVNLPMRWTAERLRGFLDEKGIVYKSAKKKNGMKVGFITFDTAEQLKKVMEELDGTCAANGNKALKVADVVPRSFEKNIKKPESIGDNEGVLASSIGCEDNDSNGDDLVSNGSASKGRSARDAVTPLAHMPYADQLEHKKNNLAQALKKLTQNARKACPTGVSLPGWILNSREIGGLPCKLEGIIESPLINGYRNKCEFSVGNSIHGKPTVGFMLGNFREGVTAVEEPTECPNVSAISCKYAAIFQEYLQQSSLPMWNRLNNSGFWRQLTVREGRSPTKDPEPDKISEVMLFVQVSTTGIDDELVNSEFEKMAQAFALGASADPPLPLTALVVQDHKGISNVAPADAPLHSIPIPRTESQCGSELANDVVDPRIHDYISNLRFSISPTAFFQVNTLAAEKLYSLAGDWAELGPDTLLFDVCCGTGTIGLTLAHRVGKVVGIEMNASAVSDAVRNAEINGIKNCKFICSKAEDVMGSLLKEYLDSSKIEDKNEICSKSEDKNENSSKSGGDQSITEGNDTSLDNITDNEINASLEFENGKTTDEIPVNNRVELDDNQPHNKGSSESSFPSVQQFKNVVAIVDPPRAGLHPTVIKALRTHPGLRKLVYISCNSETLVANAIELCTPSADQSEKGNNKNNRGWRNRSNASLARHRAKSMPESEPFQPIKSMAVDLFPHTPHCEVVMLLER